MQYHSKLFLTALIASTLVVGCGGSSSGDSGSGLGDSGQQGDLTVADATTTNHNIYLPSGVATETPSGDFDGVMVFAGSDALSSKAVSGMTLAGVSTTATTSTRDVAGFIAETVALNSETNASELVDSYESLMSSNGATLGMSYSSTGRTELLSGYMVTANYNLTLTTSSKPTDLANELVQLIGVNTAGGTVTNLPTAQSTEQYHTDYTMTIGALYVSDTDVVVAVTVVPQTLVGTYSSLTGNLTNTSNVTTSAATLTSTSDSFTAQSGSGLADFLFVIDNSGSMSSEQTAISTAASDFTTIISNSGLDYRIATITTDDSTLRDEYSDGGFTADLTEFQSDVMPGIYGSYTESATYEAEEALQSISAGDTTDGSVAAEGFPRSGASLSVIIMSDEADYYDERLYYDDYTAYSACNVGWDDGAECFDENDNLFIDRGYRVYSIVDTAATDSYGYQNYNYGGEYMTLSNNTGGSYADIGDTTAFSAIMSNIALAAGGASSSYTLAHTPLSSSITVTVDGSSVNQSTTDGWSYNQSANTIVFFGSSIPAGGASIVVSYDY